METVAEQMPTPEAPVVQKGPLDAANFSEADFAIMDSYLLVDNDAWSIDRAHARKHGRVLCMNLNDYRSPELSLRTDVAGYLENPRDAFKRIFWGLQGQSTRLMAAVVIPIESASERQKTQFSTVRRFVGYSMLEWLRRDAVARATAAAANAS